MARIRSIKPEYWTSEQVMNCSRDARCLFIGLWNFCDDGGNHPASVRTLKAEVLPGDDDATMEAMMRWIDELIEQGLLSEYEADGKEFWHVTGWHHQRIDQPTLRHPSAGDTGDAVTQGDARHLKRVGGKQRQLLIKKLRERDGDTCHLCGDTPGVTLLRVTEPSPENPHDIRTYRLVCTSCRKKQPLGDAEVTQGDAKCLAGDSLTEWSGVESNGEEGSLSPTKEEQQQASAVVGVSPASPDEVTPPDESSDEQAPYCSSAVARAVEIAVYLRQRGVVGANSINPNISAWGDDARVTNEILDAAISKARASLGTGKQLGPNYLATVIPDLLNPKPIAAKKPVDDWHRSQAGIDRKAKELGMYARGNESYDSFKERIWAELRNREQQGAAA